jgi:hypothetical protein
MNIQNQLNPGTPAIVLQGSKNDIFVLVKTTLENYLSDLNLNVSVLYSGYDENIQLAYLNQKIVFSKETIEIDLTRLYSFLLKINPKNGRICKCINCGNCKSKKR